MKGKILEPALYITAAIAVLGVAVWWFGVSGPPRQSGPVGTTAAPAGDDVASETASPGVARDPQVVPTPPSPQPPVASPSPAPPRITNGLHVLCPVPGGGSAHLLLAADTYYKAVTPEEVVLLTQLFGDPVTSVDPSRLPPKSPVSVTDALKQQLAP